MTVERGPRTGLRGWIDGTAPMMQVDNDYHEDLTEQKIDQILEKLK